MLGDAGTVRLAAAFFSAVFLLLTVAAWHFGSLGGGGGEQRGMSAPHVLSSVRSEEDPALSGVGQGGSMLSREIESMTSELGKELEGKLQSVFASKKKPEEQLHYRPPFTVHGIQGHYAACGDSVADGDVTQGINGDQDKARRFHGKVGSTYVIRCPAHCGSYLSVSHVYGCGPYLDVSSICLAGILDHKIGYESGGDVVIKLVPPVPSYESCFKLVSRYIDSAGASKLRAQRGRGPAAPAPYKKLWSTFPFSFAEWDKADGAAELTQGEYRGNRALITYRSTCTYPDTGSDVGCAGKRAFQILNLRNEKNSYNPVVFPPSGTYTGPLLVSIDAPGQRIFYTTDGQSPAGDTADSPSPLALRYRGPFYINEEGAFTVQAIGYSEMNFPPYSDVISKDYSIQEPLGGFPTELPEILGQKSLPPRVAGELQQTIPGKVSILAPKNIDNIVVPGKGSVYEIFFAVDASEEALEVRFTYPCGSKADSVRKFASALNHKGECEVTLPGGVWYVKAEGLMTGKAPCEGCQAYTKSAPVMHGPVMVKSRDGDAIPPHFQPHTSSFFAPSGTIDIIVVRRMAILFTLDGTVPVEGAPNTATCGENFEYDSDVITSKYGPKGCEVTLPEGRWMPCAMGRALDCDDFCKMMNRSLSTVECAGPYYVVPPVEPPKIYPTWESEDAPAIVAHDREAAGQWLGDPCKMVLKADKADVSICFKVKEVVKGMPFDESRLMNWPRPKCGAPATLKCGKPTPPGVYEGPDALRRDALVSSVRNDDECEISLPNGKWVMGVLGDEPVEACPPTTSKASHASCLITGEDGKECTVCPLYPHEARLKLGPFWCGPLPPCDPGHTGPDGGPCEECPEGTYKEVEGSDSCLACPANTHAPKASTAASACECNEGHTGPEGGPCSPCPTGTYKPLPGSMECTACPANSDSGLASLAETDCIANVGHTGKNGGPFSECPAGTYKDVVGSTPCKTCPPHSDSPVASAAITLCIADPGHTGPDGGPFQSCPTGTYKEVPGSSACLDCPANTDSPVASTAASACACNAGYSGQDGGPCTACPSGTYKNVIGSAECTPCPANAASPAASTVATACNCNSGYTGRNGGLCLACKRGTYKVKVGSALCLDCPPNSISPAASIAASACVCDAGYTGPDGGMCTACPSGTYKEQEGTGSCVNCPDEYTSQAGSTGAAACSPIPQPCNAGYTGPDGGPCATCPPGTYKDVPGGSLCQPCPANSGSSIASPAATACICDAGYTGPDGGPCAACPPGTYKDAEGSISCVDCPANSASPTASSIASACICNAGYTGPDGGPCTACTAGTYKDAEGGMACKVCPANSASPVASTAASACVCNAGYTGPACSPIPQPCNAGYTGPDGGPCTVCPAGKYKSIAGTGACLDCPESYTSAIGSTGAAACIPSEPPEPKSAVSGGGRCDSLVAMGCASLMSCISLRRRL